MDWLIKFVFLLNCAFGPDHPFGVGVAADLLVCHIVYKYGIPQSIVYNQDMRFTADLW